MNSLTGIVILSMTIDEAQAWRARVGSAANGLRVLLHEGHERDAWMALGYSNWTECVKSLAEEFGLSERRMWQLQAANEVEGLLNPGSVGEIPEKHLRPLAPLAPEQQRAAWQQAVDTAPNGKMTAAHVENVVNGFTAQPFVAHNTGKSEWYTPPEYLAAARAVMGAIDLDPASSAIANETVRARRFYSKENDGLNKEWRGRVWLNPPYTSELIGLFIEKLVVGIECGEVAEAIALVNNATETGWFNALIGVSSAIVFPRGRVKFLTPEGEPGAPLQGQAIVYAGKSPQEFLDSFSAFGWGARLC